MTVARSQSCRSRNGVAHGVARVDADEEPALLRPGDQVAVAAHVHRHGDAGLQQGPPLALLD
jgi:hypothetical protein